MLVADMLPRVKFYVHNFVCLFISEMRVKCFRFVSIENHNKGLRIIQ